MSPIWRGSLDSGKSANMHACTHKHFKKTVNLKIEMHFQTVYFYQSQPPT
jgi:hypothetical protein